jgi:glycosyltransferase 2 family protein
LTQYTDIKQIYSTRKITLAVSIGLIFTFISILQNFELSAFKHIELNKNFSIWFLLSIALLFLRDIAYILRLKVLIGKSISWRNSFEVIMLWEFCSALIPQILGGGFAFAIFIIAKEGVKLGKSIAVVLYSSFLDGLFFALIAPWAYFSIGKDALFNNVTNSTQKLNYMQTIEISFWIVYFVVLIYKIIIAYALFFNAKSVSNIANKLFSISILAKWKNNILQVTNEMEIASQQIKDVKISYWIYSFLATILSWCSRFFLVNTIIAAFNSNDVNHHVIFARQSVMSILNIATPTPGGSGFSEYFFSNFMGEFISNKSITTALAFLWRLLSYYPYIIIGIIIIPFWLKRISKTQNVDL